MAGFPRDGSGHSEEMTGPGTLIADRYRVVRHVGSGAMASVYLADVLHLGLDQPVPPRRTARPRCCATSRSTA